MTGCCVQVKRKGPPEAASAGDNKRARPSTPVDDELEDEGAFQRGRPANVDVHVHFVPRSFILRSFRFQTAIETQPSSPQTVPKWTATARRQSGGIHDRSNWTAKERRTTPQGKKRSCYLTGRRNQKRRRPLIGCCLEKYIPPLLFVVLFPQSLSRLNRCLYI